MKNSQNIFRLVISCFLCTAALFSLAGCGAKQGAQSALDPASPVTVTVWNYYNGDQLSAFDELVNEFNGSVGLEKGIVVVGVSQGDINTLADSLIASVNGAAGAAEKPTLAAVYSETAYILDKLDALAPLDGYFSDEELSAYISGFIGEGRFNSENELLLFPVSKSTELFTVNETDWEPFSAATGITLDSIQTKEDLTAAAEKYYEWTDSLTPDAAEDGLALYGRDSVANYIYIGCYQLGHELFKTENGELVIDMDRDVFKTLWDNYYIPYINGYYGAYAKFRSEDCKTGKILALTSSSSSVSYLPSAVTLEDDTSHDIEISIRAALPFSDAVNNAVVQQGASYCMLKSTEAEQEGAVEFLKWFTQSERNLEFAVMSGYSPVTIASNTPEAIEAAYNSGGSMQKGPTVLSSLKLCASVFSTNETYSVAPFDGSKDVRSLLESSLSSIAQADRQAVVESIAAGASRSEAVAPYITDEYFDDWFEALKLEVNSIVG